jgi:hypothetical protein
MKIFNLLILISMILTTGASASALSDSAPALFQKRSTVIVDSLARQGFVVVGELRLDELKAAIPQISWRSPVNGEDPPANVGNRASAYYISDKKEVTVIAEPQDYSPEILDILSLHEAFGALGYIDTNYEKSLALYLIAAAKENYHKDFVKDTFQLVHASRGGTSVTGGGDLIGLAVKLNVLKTIWSKHSIYLSFLYDFLQMPFEPNYSPLMHEPVYAWQEVGNPGLWVLRAGAKYSPKRVVGVTVPGAVWKRSSKSERDRIVESIADTMITHDTHGIQ